MPQPDIHNIILDATNQLQGSNTTGTGVLQVLKNHVPTIETIHNIAEENRSFIQSEIWEQASLIANSLQNGFTAETLAEQTTELSNRISQL